VKGRETEGEKKQRRFSCILLKYIQALCLGGSAHLSGVLKKGNEKKKNRKKRRNS